MAIQGLKAFPAVAGLPETETAKSMTLQSPLIKKVICCALGPEGNNIPQAAKRWIKRMGIADKSEIYLDDTPEKCLADARQYPLNGILAVFWTCAVYARENEFFFGNPDVLPFYFQETMNLDEMQLAAMPANEEQLRVVESVAEGWKIASHPSPAPLVKILGREVVLANSNAAAAMMCQVGKTQLCITTESARERYGLVKIHSFGSPPMVFFGGITQEGIQVIKGAMKRIPTELESPQDNHPFH